jgi:hypothetical protein
MRYPNAGAASDKAGPAFGISIGRLNASVAVGRYGWVSARS